MLFDLFIAINVSFFRCLLLCFFFFFLWSSLICCFFFFSSRRRHTRCLSDWSSDVCSSDLKPSACRLPPSIWPSQRRGWIALPTSTAVQNRVQVTANVAVSTATSTTSAAQIGRASCRERVETAVGAVVLRKKNTHG